MASVTSNGHRGCRSSPRVLAIMGSTREGWFSETVAGWFMRKAGERDDLNIELVDLRDWPLPFLNQAKPPSTGHRAPEAREWSSYIEEADGFILITPEYNFGYPAVLKHALDHLYQEWNGKPVAFVGYGGAAGGAGRCNNCGRSIRSCKCCPSAMTSSSHRCDVSSTTTVGCPPIASTKRSKRS